MTTPKSPSAAEIARAKAERAQVDAGIALARFEALNRIRDSHRRRTTLLHLGADPASAAPTGWATQQSVDLVAAASMAGPKSSADVATERQRLLWLAIAKIIGAVLAAAVAIAIASAMATGMAG